MDSESGMIDHCKGCRLQLLVWGWLLRLDDGGPGYGLSSYINRYHFTSHLLLLQISQHYTLITIADVYEDSQDIFVDDLDNQDAVLPCAAQMAY